VDEGLERLRRVARRNQGGLGQLAALFAGQRLAHHRLQTAARVRAIALRDLVLARFFAQNRRAPAHAVGG
jgi:hypothetical protein